MIMLVAGNIMRFLAFLLVQALVINNVEISSWVVPMVYILFLINMPLSLPRWADLLIGFAFGLCMDLFIHTPGMHASACLLLAYIRPIVFNRLAPRDSAESVLRPGIKVMGFNRFFAFIAIMVFMHHTWFFFVEVLSFSNLFITIGRILLSSAVSIALMVLTQYLFIPTPRVR